MGWFDDKPNNPLDRFFTWGAETFLPRWCQTEAHWTSRVTDYFFTDCPCCLLYRGISFGLFVGVIIGFVFGFMGAWFL